MTRAELEQIKNDDELVKALESLDINIDDVFKATEKETDEEDEEETGEDEKEYKSKSKKVKKAVKKEVDEDEEDDENEPEPDDDEDDEEYEAPKRGKKKNPAPEMMKSLTDALSQFTERLNKIENTIEKIGNTSQGMKAKQTIEKSFETETDHQILSLTKDKKKIEDKLGKILEKSTEPDIKGIYENSIISLNAGNGTISKDVAIDLFKNHKIRIVK